MITQAVSTSFTFQSHGWLGVARAIYPRVACGATTVHRCSKFGIKDLVGAKYYKVIHQVYTSAVRTHFNQTCSGLIGIL